MGLEAKERNLKKFEERVDKRKEVWYIIDKLKSDKKQGGNENV